MNIAVLMGGNSSEWEVSLRTGQAVIDAVKKIGWEVEPYPYDEDLPSVLSTLKSVDVVFNALHGGEGEDGTVQKILENLHIKYTGSGPEASSLAMDKRRTKLLLEDNQIPTPDWFHFQMEASDFIKIGKEKFTYPVVVKPNTDGSTMGVTLVKEAKEFDPALEIAEEFGSDVLIEKYIPGREITVAILGDSALPVIEILPSHELYDYTCKYTEGMSQYECPANLPNKLARQVSKTAERISALMSCRHYCRVDFRLDQENRFFCLEVNTLPGFTRTSLVPKAALEVGISFNELIKRIIQDAYNEG